MKPDDRAPVAKLIAVFGILPLFLGALWLMWQGYVAGHLPATIACGVVALGLAIVGLVLLRVKDPAMAPGFEAELRRMAATARRQEAFDGKPVPQHADDGRPIELREPGQSWKANVFWGLRFGLLLIVPSLFPSGETPAWQRYGLILAGLGWMALMGCMALRNRGKKVRADDAGVTVSHRFGSNRIALADVKQVTREDVRRKLRDFDNVGLSRWERSRRLDTTAPIVHIVLRDAAGKALLQVDEKMEPEAEMGRFVRRMENLTGAFLKDD